MPPRSCRLAPRCRLGRLERDARGVGEAEECAGPGRDRVLVGDIFADQER